MDFLPSEIVAYAEKFSSPEPQVLKELSRDTQVNVLYPQMLSGHIPGRIQSFISKLVSPKRILEVGTYTGYSAICLAEGLAEDGKLITLDINPELRKMCEKYFEKAGIRDKIELINGDALEIIPTLNETWDLVFIDADKGNYVSYYEMIKPKLRSGGIILADNVLWSGRVLDENVNDKETIGLREFNKFVDVDPEVEHVLLPVRDGIMMIRKK